jgi:Bacterial PH domain
LPRNGLQSARFEPNVMRGSIRTCGNGGLFSFTGFYRNKLLGSYRALVTDTKQKVVLAYSDRTVGLSPESPEEFVRELAVV